MALAIISRLQIREFIIEASNITKQNRSHMATPTKKFTPGNQRFWFWSFANFYALVKDSCADLHIRSASALIPIPGSEVFRRKAETGGFHI